MSNLSKLLKPSQNYKMTDGDIKLFKKSANPHNGIGINYFMAYYFKRELVPWQWYAHHASQQDASVLGGVGCIAGHSRLEGHEATIKELAKRGKPIEVVAWSGKEFVRTPASAPFLKGYEELYRVTLDDGSWIDVTANHLFLTDNGYSRTRHLCAGHLIGVLPIPHPSIRDANAHRYWQTGPDSQADCHPLCRLCDGPLHQAQDNGPEFAPLKRCI